MALLFKAGDDWSESLLNDIWGEIEVIARDDLRVSYYKPQIEIVTAKQMLDAYTSVGMPIFYRHWSFGKQFVQDERAYKAGRMGLAYEIVINSNPCIAYLMEENNALMQTLVLAHAAVGHSAVFKNNYMFKTLTDADAIVDYLTFAKKYILRCEERYGYDEVESVLDACHALMHYGVDRYKRPRKLSPLDEERRALERFEQELADYNPLWEKMVKKHPHHEEHEDDAHLVESQENILYFVEKNAPSLPSWKREIIRIVRKIAQYFEPQPWTKVLNEGFASFTHYFVVSRLYEKELIDDGSMIEFYASHNNVLYQPPYTRLNPYKLGFEIFMDIKRMCEAPTAEDEKFFPDVVGKDWHEMVVQHAMPNFRDETFILQFLSPHVARKLGLFAYRDGGPQDEEVTVTEVSREHSFSDLRHKLAEQNTTARHLPNIQVTDVDTKGSRRLTLTHFIKDGRPLEPNDASRVVNYLSTLWEYAVTLKTWKLDESGELKESVITSSGKYTK